MIQSMRGTVYIVATVLHLFIKIHSKIKIYLQNSSKFKLPEECTRFKEYDSSEVRCVAPSSEGCRCSLKLKLNLKFDVRAAAIF